MKHVIHIESGELKGEAPDATITEIDGGGEVVAERKLEPGRADQVTLQSGNTIILSIPAEEERDDTVTVTENEPATEDQPADDGTGEDTDEDDTREDDGAGEPDTDPQGAPV